MKKRTAPITQEELRRAIARYLRRGGRIHKLPDQKTVMSVLVGRRWSNSEVELDHLH